MKINEVIELAVQEEGIGDDLALTSRQYKSIIKDLKSREYGDSRATSAKNMVMSMWDKNEKVASKYKTIIKDFDLDV